MFESVHLCDYPREDKTLVDETLEEAMKRVREIVELGRTLRGQIGIKIRYPLKKAVLVCNNEVEKSVAPLVDLVKEEINVKEILFSRDATGFQPQIQDGSMVSVETKEGVVLLLDTVQTPELFAEGFSREIVRRIQSMRKSLDLAIEDRIETRIAVDGEQKKALEDWRNYIAEETRSKKVLFVDQPHGDLVKSWKLNDINVIIGITRVS